MANFQLQDSQKVSYAVAEFDKDGNIEAPGAGDSVAVASDSPSSLTVAADAAVDPAKVPNNPDGSAGDPTKYLQTGFLIGGATLKTGVQVTATFAHTDGSAAPPPVVDLIDIVVGPIATGAISLGTPVNQ